MSCGALRGRRRHRPVARGGDVRAAAPPVPRRSHGFGRRILEALEHEARRLGYTSIVLETGERQLESLGLYASAGYEQIPCYGPYAQQATGRCFEKIL